MSTQSPPIAATPAPPEPAPRAERRSTPARVRPPRSPAFAFFCTYAAFVVYGTLLPFQFSLDRDFLQRRTQRINWNPIHLKSGDTTPITDLVVNVLFFIPVGFIGVHAQRRRRDPVLVARSTTTGFFLSAFVETCQFFTLSRNPAVSDLITNTIGAAIGAVLAVYLRSQIDRRVLRRFVECVRREPLVPLLLAYALLVVVATLVPFDFAYSLRELAASWRRAVLDPRAGGFDGIRYVPRFVQFGVLGGLAWRVSHGVLGPRSIRRVAACVTAVGLFAVGLEAAGLFVRSHPCSSLEIIVSVAGGLAGMMIAGLLIATRRTHVGWTLVAAVSMACLALQALVPFQFHFDLMAMRGRITPASLVPYSTYYYRATVAAVADFLDGLLAFVPLGFVLARSRGEQAARTLRTGLKVAAICAGFALVVELLQLTVPKRSPEASDILTSALGGGLGAFAWRWFVSLAAIAARSRAAVARRAAGGETVDAAAAAGDSTSITAPS